MTIEESLDERLERRANEICGLVCPRKETEWQWIAVYADDGVAHSAISKIETSEYFADEVAIAAGVFLGALMTLHTLDAD